MTQQKNLKGIFQKKKRRIIGSMVEKNEVRNRQAWLTIHQSSRPDMITYESQGLVMAINGSGTLDVQHRQCQEAAKLAQYIVGRGGVIVNGGRNSGIMEASSAAADDQSLGILFPEIKKEACRYGKSVVVNSPQPRIELLSTCAPIVVVFRGGLGTFMALMRAIVHIKNRKFHPDQERQLVFVSNYWLGLLTTMMDLGTLPREFITSLNFFDSAQHISEKLDTLIM